MRRVIYNFLVNRHIGISQRYHSYHDNATGFKKVLSWGYLLWLNLAYYVLLCRFLGRAKEVLIYEEKRLSVGKGESYYLKETFRDDVDSLVGKLSGYDIISFDIFDTLIFRPFSEPSDMFYLIGERLGFMDFKRLRIMAEARARELKYKEKGTYEVTLLEIWDILSAETGLDKEEGLQLEERLEVSVCYANPFLKRVYDRLVSMGKRLVIISDMYLKEGVLREILAKNGYNTMEKLYVSCEYGVNKAGGRLYDRVKQDLGLTKEAGLEDIWIHVGDNVNSDINQAKEAGLSTYHYPNVNMNTYMYRAYDMSPIVGGAYRGVVNNHIYNGLRVYSKEYEYGYIYGGLFVLGYCSFIHEYCGKNHIDKVLFLSRDGDILKQVYEILYPDDDTEYVYWSRRVATKLMSENNRYDFYRRFIYHKQNSGLSIKAVLEGMELECLCHRLPDSLKADSELNDSNADVLRSFIEQNWQYVKEAYADEHKGGRSYLEELLKGCGRVCAVDIGWAGSGAIAISHLVEKVWRLDCEVVGMIAGTNTIHNAEPYVSETFLLNGKLVSYLYSMSHNRDLMKKHNPNADFNVYWELLLSSPTRQFKGFSYDNENKHYILNFGKYDANRQGILDIQQGIKDFAYEYCRHFKDFPYMLNISGRDAYAPMLVAASNRERYLKDINKRFKLDIGIS